MNKKILITGAVAGLLAVILDAFGAHGLERFVDEKSINSFTIGVRYQMYHAIVCVIIGNTSLIKAIPKKRIFYSFLIGMILFCGSIYLLVIDQILGIDLSSIGFITPLGGLFFIFGWILLTFSYIKIK